MSQENVDAVRRGIEAWNAGNMDAFREMHDPDVIVRTVADWPEPGPYVGREAVMRSFEQLRDTWDVETLEVTSDFIDAGDRVVVRLIWHGVGQGPQLNLELTDVVTVRKGRIRGHEYFWDHAEALEAAGLRE
jgi:ketosteroid isomerase-like protein